MSDLEGLRAAHAAKNQQNGYFLGIDSRNNLYAFKPPSSGGTIGDEFLWQWNKAALVTKRKRPFVVNIKWSNNKRGARVNVQGYTGGLNQQWKVEDGQIVSKMNGKVLDMFRKKYPQRVGMWDS